MAQEGAFWLSRVIRLGPHWRSSKITWANIVHAMLDDGTYSTIVGAVKSTVAHQ